MRRGIALSFFMAVSFCAPVKRSQGALTHSMEEPGFVEVDPANPVPKIFASHIHQALKVLDQIANDPVTLLQGKIAKATLERINDGSVEIDTLTGAIPSDLLHMCRDLKMEECSGEGNFKLTAALRRKILSSYAGYMWGNRVYLTLAEGSEVLETASTLVHEIIHVLNRSECHYYSDFKNQVVDADLAFKEEYRSFVGECIFVEGSVASPERCHEFAIKKIKAGYKFSAKVDETFAAKIFEASKQIVPNKSNWPRHFSDCH